jgi:hypothetical protein
VVAVRHELEPVATGYLSRSDDGGATWVAQRLPTYAPDALPFLRLVVGRDGTYHLFSVEATLRTFTTASARSMTVRTSTDRGLTWTMATRITGEVPWQWPSGGVGPDGTLFVQWLRADSGTKALLLARSSDGGTTWSSPVVAATGLVGPEPSLAITPSGTLAVAHVAPVPGAGGQRELRLTTSTDRGSTWTMTVLDGPYDTPPNEGFFNETVATTDGRIAAIYTRPGRDHDEPTDVYVAVLPEPEPRRASG